MTIKLVGAVVLAAMFGCVGSEEDMLLAEDESEVINGLPWPEQNSGIVRLFMLPGTRRCTGTLVTNDIILTSASCIAGFAPPQITASMNSQGRNITAIAVHPTVDVALLRVSFAFTMFPRSVFGGMTGYQAQLYPYATNTLAPGTNLLCRGFGETTFNANNSGTLNFALLPVRGVNFTWWGSHVDLGVNMNPLGQFLSNGDMGASCFATLPNGQQVLAGVASRLVNFGGATFNDLVGAESFRSWYESLVVPSADAAVQWGTAGDIPVPADFDGDGRDDYVVFRPSSGVWFVRSSATLAMSSQQWGTAGDIPFAKDFDYDGRPDYGVLRNGRFLIRSSVTGATIDRPYGVAGDKPVPADYDGDGRVDFAVWRPSNGFWIVTFSSTSFTVAKQWGTNGDVPVPADYDRDGRAELGVWRPWTGEWWTKSPLTDAWRVYTVLGQPGDTPITAYIGCGGAKPGVWRPAPAGYQFAGDAPFSIGQAGDVPVMANFAGSSAPDFAVWRPSTGMWFVVTNLDGC